ncbi:hypothetical protein D8B26_003965 [Coccidioides posadasii str. Silveira]|uniref:Predicted protein n=1 Tax=Coccidioides posadasii (strain RMSCC 757 / Silveira) TaxID=443226 RepID=E9D9K0_COCPS|nr:predicted protein [Coccidioides posadasii str. Silveira]QVM09302.1 hypothetical protein D8B26_003965 [Coccidioides posadasii str. Silveira]
MATANIGKGCPKTPRKNNQDMADRAIMSEARWFEYASGSDLFASHPHTMFEIPSLVLDQWQHTAKCLTIAQTNFRTSGNMTKKVCATNKYPSPLGICRFIERTVMDEDHHKQIRSSFYNERCITFQRCNRGSQRMA